MYKMRMCKKMQGVVKMKNVLIVGAGKLGTTLLKMFLTMKQYKVTAVVDRDASAPGMVIAREHHIETSHSWREWINETLDIVIDATNSNNTYGELVQNKPKDLLIIPSMWSEITVGLSEQKEEVIQKFKKSEFLNGQVMENIPLGLIVVDDHERVTFINTRAEELSGIKKHDIISKPIRNVLEKSRLPEVMRSRSIEVNKELVIKDKKLYANYIPIVDGQSVVTGAFSSFYDRNEVIVLAEQITGLTEIKKTLAAIFSSTDEAISIVNEEGKVIIVNPAYERLTEQWKKGTIEGEKEDVIEIEELNLHKKALQTRRPIRGVRMQFGTRNKEMIVSATPIIVESKLKGSLAVLRDVTKTEALTNELKQARQIIRNLESTSTFDDIVGGSNELTLALEQAKVGAKTSSIVLLRGESGTGKELFAQAIHNESNRKHNKFIRVNCGQRDSILETELLGVEEKVEPNEKYFVRKGLLEEADQGTIFLDEVSELPLGMQDKLLKFLEQDTFVRLGGTKSIRIDVRIITSSSRNLEKAVRNGSFREELYYKLNRLPIFIPPLKDRLIDLTELAYHCVHKLNEYYGRNVSKIEEDVITYFKRYHWPGNVRELENVISRAMLRLEVREDTVRLKDIPDLSKLSSLNKKLSDIQEPIWNGQTLQTSLDKHEKQVILAALTKNHFNKTKTANVLGISIRSLYYKMDKFKIAKDGMQ